MWNALGNNYEKLEKRAEALRCYERSENFKDREGIALFKKARMYDILGFQEKAVKCFEENLMRKDEERQVDKDLGQILIYLANYYKSVGNINKALEYAGRLYDFQGIEREEAQNLLFELNTMLSDRRINN